MSLQPNNIWKDAAPDRELLWEPKHPDTQLPFSQVAVARRKMLVREFQDRLTTVEMVFSRMSTTRKECWQATANSPVKGTSTKYCTAVWKQSIVHFMEAQANHLPICPFLKQMCSTIVTVWIWHWWILGHTSHWCSPQYWEFPEPCLSTRCQIFAQSMGGVQRKNNQNLKDFGKTNVLSLSLWEHERK